MSNSTTQLDPTLQSLELLEATNKGFTLGCSDPAVPEPIRAVGVSLEQKADFPRF
jgi:hypothetical protein